LNDHSVSSQMQWQFKLFHKEVAAAAAAVAAVV
jgi:hypothetical protein